MRSGVMVAVAAVVVAGCSTSPAAKAPLREALAKAELSDVESAVRGCLADTGWKVDDVGSYSGGANVVTAYKAKDQTDVYIYPADTKPRITGGPDDSNPFWKCLGKTLSGGGGDSTDDKSKDDKGKDKDDKGDKAPGGDKGGGT